MNRTFILAALSALALLSTGCASIVSRSRWPVTISSFPNGATVDIVDRKGTTIYHGTTPATLKLRSGGGYFRKQRYTVDFSMEGHQPKRQTIDFQMNGWYVGNILVGGFIGFLIVDPLTGAMYRPRSEYVHAILAIDTAENTEPALRILMLDEVPEDLLGMLEPVR